MTDMMMRSNPSRCGGSRLVLITVALLLLSATVAAAQATRPAAATRPAPADANASSSAPAAGAARRLNWPDVLARLGNALAEKDVRAVTALLDPPPLIRAFGSDAAQPAERLLAATMGGKVLSVHAYLGVPMTVATDVAADLKEAGDTVPQTVAQGLTPADDTAARRANETAAAWVAQVLKPGPEELVGLILVCPTDRRDPSDTAARHAVFVLIKGVAAGGGCAIQRIHFGDPLESVR